MHARANQYRTDSSAADEPDREELYETVASLRRDVSSMASDIREVLRENAELREELDRSKGQRQGQRSGEQWLSEAERIKREVDQLVQLHEAASAARPRRRPAPRREMRASEGRDEGPAWMKKMMMFMMLSEMV